MDNSDWASLATTILPDTKKVSYEENKQFFTKLAFDVFQLNTSPVESLWVLQDADDGKQYLVAQYDEEEKDTLSVKSSWEAFSDADKKNVSLYYKGELMQRFASSDFGFSCDDAHVFQKTLIQTFGSDKEFVSKFLKSQPQEKQDRLIQKFPELA